MSGSPTGVGFVSPLLAGNLFGGVPGNKESTGSSLTTTGFFMVTNSILVEVGFGGRLFGGGGADGKTNSAKVCVSHG